MLCDHRKTSPAQHSSCSFCLGCQKIDIHSTRRIPRATQYPIVPRHRPPGRPGRIHSTRRIHRTTQKPIVLRHRLPGRPGREGDEALDFVGFEADGHGASDSGQDGDVV